MSGRDQILLVSILLAFSTIFHSQPSTAQSSGSDGEPPRDGDFEPVHWAYSAFFGTGWYQMNNARSVFALRLPPKKTLRKSSISDSGERTIGIEINYPLTVGLHDIRDLNGIIENDNFGTVTFVPGLELEIPINSQWYMRTFADVGWGKELEFDNSALIYSAGVKSQYEFPSDSKYKWYLLNSLYYAGYTPDKGRPDYLTVAEVGIELLQPLNKASLADRPIDLHWVMMYSLMGRDLHFNLPDDSVEPIEDQMEFTLQTSFRDGPLKVSFIDIYRLGIGYRFSSNSSFSAITLSMRSWFSD